MELRAMIEQRKEEKKAKIDAIHESQEQLQITHDKKAEKIHDKEILALKNKEEQMKAQELEKKQQELAIEANSDLEKYLNDKEVTEAYIRMFKDAERKEAEIK